MITTITLLLAVPWAQTHLTYPLNYCNMASTCVHDNAPVCGTSTDGCQRRSFLDTCDMYEYNCDYNTQFVTKAVSSCTNGQPNFTC